MRIFDVEVTTTVRVEIPDAHVAEVLTDEWRGSFYPLHTPAELAEMLAYNAVLNGRDSSEQMDGWIGIEPAQMSVMHDYSHAQEVTNQKETP